MKALLLSGGLDSAALAAWLRPDICVTIDYGQRAAPGEVAAAEALARELGLRQRTVRVDLAPFGSGLMAAVPAAAGAAAPEFWPYRNQMLATLAGMLLLPAGLSSIIIGTVSTDLHADGRPKFLRRLDRLMRAQEGEVAVVAPAARMSSVALLRRSKFPRRLVGLTFSCHVHEYACGQCGGCEKHRDVVEQVFGPIPAPVSKGAA
jgi:7-cyano-7-deazaguanine synthase